MTHSHVSGVHHITGEVFSLPASVFPFGSSLQDVVFCFFFKEIQQMNERKSDCGRDGTIQGRW